MRFTYGQRLRKFTSIYNHRHATEYIEANTFTHKCILHLWSGESEETGITYRQCIDKLNSGMYKEIY